MPTLAFNVEADYQKVIKLRDEIARLEQTLNGMQGNGSEEAIAELETQLSAAREEMKKVVSTAAELGTSVEQSVAKMQFGTVEEQMNALAVAIHENEQAMAKGAQQLEVWRQQAQEAFSEGNMGTVEAITADIKDQVARMQELQQQTDGYREALQGLASSGVDTSLQGISNSIAGLDQACDQNRAEIERLTAEYNKLNAQYERGVAEGSKEEQAILSRMQTIRGEITVRRSLIKEMQGQATALEENKTKTEQATAEVNQTTQAHENLRSKMRQLKQEMAEMRLQGIDEQSEAYRRLRDELGRLQDVQGDIQRQGSILANDERAIAGVQSGIQGLTGAFMGANAAVGLFGASNQSLQQILVKSHYLMAISNGLQQAAAMLNKDSAFRLVTLGKAREWWNKLVAIGTGQEIADTAATTANTAAEDANTASKVANTAAQTGNTAALTGNTAGKLADASASGVATAANITLAGAFRMLGAAIKSIPVIGWALAAIGAVAGAVALLVKHVKNANKATEEAKEKAQEFYKSVSEGAYKPIGSLKMLQSQWEKLSSSLAEREKFIENNKREFDALGVTINNVAEAEKFFASQAQTFINAQIAKAKATVLLNQAMDKTKEATELEQEIEAGTYANTSKNWLGMTKWTGELDEQKKKLAELREEETKRYDAATKALEEQYKLEDQAGVTRNSETSSSTTSAATITKNMEKDLTKETARYRELVERQGKERARSATQMQLEVRQAEITAMEDGNDKTLAQIDLDFQAQEIAIIQWYEDLKEKKLQEARALWEANPETRNRAFDPNAINLDYTAEENALFDAQMKANERKRQESIDAIQKTEEKSWNDYLVKYGDYLEKRQALINKYQSSMDEATTEGERATLGKELEQQLYELDNAARQTTSLIAQMFADMSAKSIKEIRSILDNAELLMSYLEGEKDENGNTTINGQNVSRQEILDLGVTPETLDMLANSPEELDKLSKAIASLKKELGNKSPFEKLSKDLKDAWDTMKDGDIGTGLMQMAAAIGEVLPEIKQFGEDIGTIFGNDKIGESVGYAVDAFEGLLGMGAGVGQMMSGDIVGGIMSATSGLAAMVSALGSLFGSDSDKTLHKDMEALTYSNEALKKSVDNLTDEMNKSTTSLTQATEDYATAKKNLEQMEADTAAIMQRAGTSHSTWSHSSDYYVDKNMTDADWEAVSLAAGRAVTSAGDFWSLTSEEMYNVSVQAAAQYAKIKQYADDGHDDAAQYMDEYIALWQELQDVTDAYYQKLTSTDFDSIVSNFQSAIMDMNHSAADFADDFENMMKNAVVSSLMSSTYSKQLENWYNQFAKYMETGGELELWEQNQLKDEYDRIVSEAQNDINKLYETLGWSREGYSQSATTGGFTAMTEDTAEELNGRFTALQEAGYQILAIEQENYSLMASMADVARENRAILADSYLELQSINDNTADTVEQLLIMVKYMKSVKENTDKL